MSFVIYNKETTQLHTELVSGRAYWPKHFDTERGAKMVLTRNVNKGKYKKDEWAIADLATFKTNIEKTETRINLMSGKEFTQPVNTPLCCDPSSETYWSM